MKDHKMIAAAEKVSQAFVGTDNLEKDVKKTLEPVTLPENIVKAIEECLSRETDETNNMGHVQSRVYYMLADPKDRMRWTSIIMHTIVDAYPEETELASDLATYDAAIPTVSEKKEERAHTLRILCKGAMENFFERHPEYISMKRRSLRLIRIPQGCQMLIDEK